VVRGLVTAGVVLAFCGTLVGCSPAAPIDLGTDYYDVSAAGSEGTGDTDPGDNAPGEAADPSLVESNGGSAICGQPFAACGGALAGTWVVEDTCSAETRNRKALQMWGQNLMKTLDASACVDAARRLISRWSGVLAFEEGIAIDQRQRLRTLDVDIKPTCLSASFGIQDPERLNSPAACDALQDDTTSCALAGGLCRCTSRVIDAGKVSGVYGVLKGQVAIAAGPPGSGSEIYNYCVQGDRLIWQERGTATPVVLRRLAEGTMPDPVGFPR
jgi:hypothetical protein